MDCTDGVVESFLSFYNIIVDRLGSLLPQPISLSCDVFVPLIDGGLNVVRLLIAYPILAQPSLRELLSAATHEAWNFYAKLNKIKFGFFPHKHTTAESYKIYIIGSLKDRKRG